VRSYLLPSVAVFFALIGAAKAQRPPVNGFVRPEFAGEAAGRAFSFLACTDALRARRPRA
jgi:hypothetical protein